MAEHHEYWRNAVAIVTGSGQGIGLGIAGDLAARGATVVLAEYNRSVGEAAAASIREQGLSATFVQCDVSQSTEVDDLVARTVRDFGKVSIAVNNAGIVRANMLWNLTDAEWNAVIATNMSSQFFLVRAVAKAWMIENGGAIVNVSSIGGLRGSVGQINYATAKAGVVGLTKAAALELGRYGVRVNAVAPGTTDTPMTKTIMETDKLRERFQKEIPLGRFGQPQDVARAVAFLVGPESDWISGKVLIVDGGAYN